MFMNRSNNIQKLANLKPLLRTLISAKQSNRQSSSNDGVNDENFENQNSAAKTTSTTSASSKSTDQTNKKQIISKTTAQIQKNKNVNDNKMFIEINLFGPKDVRLPLPGNVGFASKKHLKLGKNKIRKAVEKEFKLIKEHNPLSNECLTTTIELSLNNYETTEERQNRVFENVVYNQKDELSLERNQNKFKSLFFVKVYSSTHFLLNDLKQIFPKECLFEKDFVIISVYKNPFSKLVDANLKEEFINLGNSIAESLNKMGCWVNFLEPDSKRSFNDLVSCLNLEPDERFINYGVEIENFADCKFINQVNNAKLFIGTVFTTAKIDSLELDRVLKLLTKF